MTEQRTIAATQQQVDDKAAVQRLALTEADVQAINPAGHRRYHEVRDDAKGPDENGDYEWMEVEGADANGRYKWTNTYRPNDGHGNLTPIAHEMLGGMKRFTEADTARMGAMQERAERVTLRDADGGVHHVAPEMADAAAERNGWHHRFTGRPTRTYRGGRWYRREGREWRAE